MPATRPRARRVAPLVTLLFLAVLIGGIVYFLMRSPAVTVGEVRRETVVRELAVTGRVQPRFVNRIVPTVSGRVTRLPRDEGQRVQPGDILAVIDTGVPEAEVGQARAVVAKRQSEVETTRRDYERFLSLSRDGVVSDQEYERARLAYQQAQADLREAQRSLDAATERLQDYILRAPYAGQILSRPIDPGQTVQPDTVIYEMGSEGIPVVEADIDEQYLPNLRLGMPAIVSPSGAQGFRLDATICRIGPLVQTTTGAATVRFCFTGKPPTMPANLTVDVNVRVDRWEAALTVPRESIAGLGTAPYVFVIEMGRARRQPVDLVDWPAERVVVTSGVREGQKVALQPRELQDEMAVRARKP